MLMARFKIHMINSEFESCEDGEYISAAAAMRAGVNSATRVASEAVAAGAETAAVEIRIEDEHGGAVAGKVVTLTVSEFLK